MGFIRRWFSPKVAQDLAQPESSFYEQLKLEAEGVAANNAGLRETDCPYENGGFEWNHWTFGWWNCQGERQIIAAGGYAVCTTDAGAPGGFVSLKALEAMGTPWKPVYLSSAQARPLSTGRLR